MIGNTFTLVYSWLSEHMLSNFRFMLSYAMMLLGVMMCCPLKMSLHVTSATTVCCGGTVIALFNHSMLFSLCSGDFAIVLI